MKIILLILPTSVVRTQHTMEGEGCYRVYLGYTFIFQIWQEILISHMTYDVVHTQKCHFGSTINTRMCCIPLEGIWLSDS